MDNVMAVLAELEEKRRRVLGELARVERVIAVVEELAAERRGRRMPAVMDEVVDVEVVDIPATVTAVAAEGAAVSPLPAVLKPYLMMNFYEAAAAYLASVGEPQSARQIAEGLAAGGFPTRSRYFRNVAGTLLRRKESRQVYHISATPNGRRWFVRRRKSSAGRRGSS